MEGTEGGFGEGPQKKRERESEWGAADLQQLLPESQTARKQPLRDPGLLRDRRGRKVPPCVFLSPWIKPTARSPQETPPSHRSLSGL